MKLVSFLSWLRFVTRPILVPSSLSPVVNIRCLIHPVQCQQFKRALFVFLSASISVILMWVLRSHFSACAPSKRLKCMRISECDTIFRWYGAIKLNMFFFIHKMHSELKCFYWDERLLSCWSYMWFWETGVRTHPGFSVSKWKIRILDRSEITYWTLITENVTQAGVNSCTRSHRVLRATKQIKKVQTPKNCISRGKTLFKHFWNTFYKIPNQIRNIHTMLLLLYWLLDFSSIRKWEGDIVKLMLH